MTNINKQVWSIIENDAAVRKTLLEGLINVSALARKIVKEHHLDNHVDAVISAIRRYEGTEEKKTSLKKIYRLLKAAKLTTRTRLASILLKKNAEIRKKLGDLYKTIDFEGGDTLRILEVSKYIKVIVDDKSIHNINDIFDRKDVVETRNNLGELSINYHVDITKVAGLFSTLSNELASNGISIVDSMICHSEHIIVVEEQDIEETFNVVFQLTHK